jgi:hypothetical protein
METGDRRSDLRGSVSGRSRSRVRLARVGAVGSLRGVGRRSNARRRRRQRAGDRACRRSRCGHRIDRDWSTRDAGRRARVCRGRSRRLGRVVRLAGGRLRDIGSEHVCRPARDDVHSRGGRHAVGPSSGRLSARSRVRPRPDLPISRRGILCSRSQAASPTAGVRCRSGGSSDRSVTGCRPPPIGHGPSRQPVAHRPLTRWRSSARTVGLRGLGSGRCT